MEGGNLVYFDSCSRMNQKGVFLRVFDPQNLGL